MKKIIIFVCTFLLLNCSEESIISEKELLKQKVEAFQFLSKYHSQLHVMIGEDEGDMAIAYKEFHDAVLAINNVELLPVKNSTIRIDPNDVNQESESVKRLDYLVDYYQSGLSMQIEAIFRGHGHLEILEIENAMNIYEKIKSM